MLEAVRPITFGDDSIHSIEEGLKWQTRRLGLPRPPNRYLGYMMIEPANGIATLCGEDYPDAESDWIKCPYGKPGDVLWVREAWAPVPRPPVRSGQFHDKCIGNPEGSDWKLADPKIKGVTWRAAWVGNPSGYKWKSPRFMPKWATRMHIRIDKIRVELLQNISEKDAKAEGIKGKGKVWYGPADKKDHFRAFTTPKEAFASHWDAINGKRTPPRVFVYENGKSRIVGSKNRQETRSLPLCKWNVNDWVFVLDFSVVWRYGQQAE